MPAINKFLEMGFNVNQATSLAWAEYFENRMAEIEYRYQGNVDGSVRIDCHCHDCDTGGQFLPDSVRNFIMAHKGHKTKTRRLR